MSTHSCPVVKVDMKPHPNAENLSIMEIDGYEVCMRTADWTNGQLAVHVLPDYVVPDTEHFAWLKTDSNNWNRVKTRKFRQRYSYGFLIPADGLGLNEGDNAMETLGITRYEPPDPMTTGGDNVRGPDGFYPKYDIENYQKYKEIIKSLNVDVVATEKLHGANAKYTYQDGQMWAGSRTNWKAEEGHCVWWRAIQRNDWIVEWCQNNPGLVVYGEVFGNVQKLKYGAKTNDVFFRAFDILDKDTWLDYDKMVELAGDTLQLVPELYRGPFNEDKLMEIAMGNTCMPNANHIREGLVVRPITEHYYSPLGRVVLKMVSPRYLEKDY